MLVQCLTTFSLVLFSLRALNPQHGTPDTPLEVASGTLLTQEVQAGGHGQGGRGGVLKRMG